MTDRLVELGDAVDAFVAERDWAQFHTPKNLAMSVAIEAAELMEHFQWGTDAGSAALDAAQRKRVAQEMGDVLIYLVRLSRVLDIDPQFGQRTCRAEYVGYIAERVLVGS